MAEETTSSTKQGSHYKPITLGDLCRGLCVFVDFYYALLVTLLPSSLEQILLKHHCYRFTKNQSIRLNFPGL